MFCAFGAHLEPEPNRFQRLQKTHPKCYEVCMRSIEDGGLGMTVPLEYVGIPYTTWETEGQMSIADFPEIFAGGAK